MQHFKKNYNKMLDVVGYVNIMERGGKRRTNLNTHYEKLFFEKSSDPDSCEIEKCTMRNHQIVLTNRFVMHN